MRKAHILAEHPYDPAVRCKVFVDGNLILEFDGDEYLANIPDAQKGIATPAEFRGHKIRAGTWIIGQSADPSRTLAELTRDMVLAEAEEYDVPITVTEL